MAGGVPGYKEPAPKVFNEMSVQEQDGELVDLLKAYKGV